MIRKHIACLSLFAISALTLSPAATIASDWPEFLGPNGAAHSDANVPTTWSDTENLRWKIALPGSGSSSPIITGDKLLVTCYVEGGSPSRILLCFDKRSGEKIWEVSFPIDYREDSYRGFITEHGYASNTPATDGEDVFVFLGKGGVHCVSLDGVKKWSVDVGKESSSRQWGSASSILLYKNSVIVNAAEESKTLYCLNKESGDVIWKQQADMLELTYGTPRLAKSKDGSDELLISVPQEVWSLDPETGKLNWFAETPSTGNVSPSIIVDDGVAYTFGGFRDSGSSAITIGGKDDVTDSNVKWTSRATSYVATPLLHNGKFYWIDDRGVAHCSSADDGSELYRERAGDIGGGRPVYASPVMIGDYIYLVTRAGGTVVLPPKDRFEPVAQNRFESDESDFNASPAVSDGCLYLRSNKALYCIGD